MSIQEIWKRMSVQRLLWASGILALISIAFPLSVLIGMFLLVLPGLALMLAPTVFLYTAIFALVRRYLPISHARALNVVAAFITLGLGVLVPFPMWLAGSRAFHQAATGDVVPHDRVVIRGDVLLNDYKTRTEYVAGNPYSPCNALCAALLDTPGVSTVTIARTDAPISYRLVPKGEATSKAMSLKDPEEILEYLPAKSFNRADFAARNALVNAIKARWGLRLANEVTLSIVPSPAHHDLTITLSLTSRQEGHDAGVMQVDVRDREGRLLLRRQAAWATRVFVPLLLLPKDPFGGGPPRLARVNVSTQGGSGGITALFEDTTLAWPSGPGAAATGARDRLAAAVMQPDAPADLAIAGSWLKTIDYQSISDRDLELLGQLIADARVTDLSDLYVGYNGPVRAELRGPIVARLLNPTTPGELRHRLDTVVRFMPPGTFAVSTPDEVALLHNPLRRSPGLIERLADQGKAGVPELVRILQEELRGEPWPNREAVVVAVRLAFVRLGPDAASALPVVIDLFDRPETPLAVGFEQMGKWRIAMVRMGRPVEEVPFPPGSTDAQIARLRSELMRSVELARKNPDWAR